MVLSMAMTANQQYKYTYQRTLRPHHSVSRQQPWRWLTTSTTLTWRTSSTFCWRFSTTLRWRPPAQWRDPWTSPSRKKTPSPPATVQSHHSSPECPVLYLCAPVTPTTPSWISTKASCQVQSQAGRVTSLGGSSPCRRRSRPPRPPRPLWRCWGRECAPTARPAPPPPGGRTGRADRCVTPAVSTSGSTRSTGLRSGPGVGPSWGDRGNRQAGDSRGRRDQRTPLLLSYSHQLSQRPTSPSQTEEKYLRNIWDLLIKPRYESFQHFCKKIWCNLSVFWYRYWQCVSNINTMVWPPWADVISPVSPHWSVNSLICRGVSITHPEFSLLTVSHRGDINHCRCDSASSEQGTLNWLCMLTTIILEMFAGDWS